MVQCILQFCAWQRGKKNCLSRLSHYVALENFGRGRKIPCDDANPEWLSFSRYDMLSPGEMQRVGFLRLFYHQPCFAGNHFCFSQIIRISDWHQRHKLIRNVDKSADSDSSESVSQSAHRSPWLFMLICQKSSFPWNCLLFHSFLGYLFYIARNAHSSQHSLQFQAEADPTSSAVLMQWPSGSYHKHKFINIAILLFIKSIK